MFLRQQPSPDGFQDTRGGEAAEGKQPEAFQLRGSAGLTEQQGPGSSNDRRDHAGSTGAGESTPTADPSVQRKLLLETLETARKNLRQHDQSVGVASPDEDLLPVEDPNPGNPLVTQQLLPPSNPGPDKPQGSEAILAQALLALVSGGSEKSAHSQLSKHWDPRKTLKNGSSLFSMIWWIRDVTISVTGGADYSLRLKLVREYGTGLSVYTISISEEMLKECTEQQYKAIVSDLVLSYAKHVLSTSSGADGDCGPQGWSLDHALRTAALALPLSIQKSGVRDIVKVYGVIMEACKTYEWLIKWLGLTVSMSIGWPRIYINSVSAANIIDAPTLTALQIQVASSNTLTLEDTHRILQSLPTVPAYQRPPPRQVVRQRDMSVRSMGDHQPSPDRKRRSEGEARRGSGERRVLPYPPKREDRGSPPSDKECWKHGNHRMTQCPDYKGCHKCGGPHFKSECPEQLNRN